MSFVTSAAMKERLKGFPFTIGVGGCVLALLLVPPLFERVFALSPLEPEDGPGLWALAAAVLLCSALVGLNRLGARNKLAAMHLSVVALLTLELCLRLVLGNFQPEVRSQLVEMARSTYPRQMSFQGHPFLQFVGSSSHRSPEGHRTFNSRGFPGPEFQQKKPAGTVRVACLGGSTTQYGYPAALDEYLNQQGGKTGKRFEALNFGLSSYTTAHSLVNFVLNVVHLSPDYVVIHHAWNDEIVRDVVGGMSSDYSHAFDPFSAPAVPLRTLVRASVMVRYALYLVVGRPRWASLENALVKEVSHDEPRYRKPAELTYYRRNLQTMMDLAVARGVVPVLTTQPYTTDESKHETEMWKHIKQCNTIVRTLAKEYGDRVLFVDLDRKMTGAMNHLFKDLGHLTDPGIAVKARTIGKAILDHHTGGGRR